MEEYTSERFYWIIWSLTDNDARLNLRNELHEWRNLFNHSEEIIADVKSKCFKLKTKTSIWSIHFFFQSYVDIPMEIQVSHSRIVVWYIFNVMIPRWRRWINCSGLICLYDISIRRQRIEWELKWMVRLIS